MLSKYIVGSFWTKQLKKYDNCNIIIVSAPRNFDYQFLNTQMKKCNVVVFKKVQKHLIPAAANCNGDVYIIGFSVLNKIPNIFSKLVNQNLCIHGIFARKYFITKENLVYMQNMHNPILVVLALLTNVSTNTPILLKTSQMQILRLINSIGISKIS